jgi:signal transduction histidine kinase
VSNVGPGEPLLEAVDRLREEVAALRRSRRRLAEDGYAERRQIERDLHDGVQQHLVALAVNLHRLIRLVDHDPVAAQALLEEMASNTREALAETTELARRIDPPLYEGRGLASAIRSAAERAGVAVLIEAPARPAYPAEIMAAVYWSCVAALSSAPRGSQATLTVHDADGRLMFDITLVGRSSEGRLDRLCDRIEALDGGISVDDLQDDRTRVHAWLPLSS